MSAALILHGVVRAGASLPSLPEACTTASAAGLSAFIGPAGPLAAPDEADRAGLEALLARHHALLAGAAALGEVLPLRFGTLVADRAGAAGLLARRAAAFEAGFTRLAGRAQYQLDLALPEGAPPPAPSGGRGYLRARAAARAALQAAETRAEALADRAAEILAAAEGADLRPAPAPAAAGGATRRLLALLPRPAVDGVAARLAALAADAPEADFTLSGPWPPYDFAAAALEEDAA